MYDASQTKPDEEKEEESAFAPLLAGAAPSSAPTSAGAPAVAPHKSAGAPGFVNFDRVLNANKDVVDRTKSEKQASVNSRYSSLMGGLDGARSAVAPPAADAPPAGATIAPNSTRDVQSNALGSLKQGLSDESRVTREQAEQGANATYAGPTQQDVDSKYASLLSDKNKLTEEANAAKSGSYTGNAFDDALLGARGGVDYSKIAGVDKAYGDSYNAAGTAVTDAKNQFDAAKSAWQTLLDNNPKEDPSIEASRIAESKARIERKAKTDAYVNQSTDPKFRQDFQNLSPEDQDAVMALDTQDPYYAMKASQIMNKAKDQSGRSKTLAGMMESPGFKQIFAKLSPEERTQFKAAFMRGDMFATADLLNRAKSRKV